MEKRQKLSATDLANLLGSWAVGERPLFRLLADALVRLVDLGQLEPEIVLPPERELANSLPVSRSTVVQAYELLKSGGWITSRQGSGTWVQPRNHLRIAAGHRALPSPAESSLFAGLANGLVAHRDLSVSAMPALDVVWEAFREINDQELSEVGRVHGYEPAGLYPVRAAVAERYSQQGLPTTPEQILITTGAAQAIALLAIAYLRPADAAVVEDPTCPVALAAVRATRARMLPARVEADGVDVDSVEQALKHANPRLVYLTPTFHNPTGCAMSTDRRERLALLAQRFQVPLIEDLATTDIVLGEDPPPPIASYDPAAPVITIGSLSKLFWSGLRIGWIRAQSHLVARLARLKSVADLGSPVLAQLHAAHLLGRSDHARAQRQAQLQERLDRAADALSRRLPDWGWRRPAGGISLWIELPNGDATRFVQTALYHGVAIVPGSVFAVSGADDSHIRLSFAQSPEALDDAIEALARAWRSHQADRPQLSTQAALVI